MKTEVTPEMERAMKKAKAELLNTPKSAFFVSVAFSLRHQFSETVPTAATNGSRVYYNPQFFMSLTPPEQVFLMLHETMHVVLEHLERVNDRDKKLWNSAGDFVINLMLTDAGFRMPSGGLLDRAYAGMSTEQVYRALVENQEEQNAQDQEAGGGQGQGNPGGPMYDDLLEPGYDPDTGELIEGSPQTPEQLQQQAQNILKRAYVEAQIAKQADSIPGVLLRSIRDLMDPKLPWNRILQRYLLQRKRTEYLFNRPNRRYYPDHYLPSPDGQGIETVTIAIDASGSVSADDFNRFFAEVRKIMQEANPKKTTVWLFDNDIRASKDLHSTRQLNTLAANAGGGTEILPVLQRAAQEKPELLIVFSDGYFHDRYAPDEMAGRFRGKHVIWVIDRNPSFTAPFGKVIHFGN